MLERFLFALIGFVAGCGFTYLTLWIWSVEILYMDSLDRGGEAYDVTDTPIS